MRLSQHQIREIVLAHAEKKPVPEIAATFHVDASTVRFHVDLFEQRYGSVAAIYSLVPVKKRECVHPSLKCLLCGIAQDHIHRREIEAIAQLEQRIDAANEILKREGFDTV